MSDETPPLDVAASVDPGPYGRATWKVRLAVLVFALVLVVVTGEGLARATLKREAPLWVDHPLCWRVQTPNAKVRRGVGDKAWDYETNAFGFRGKSVTVAKRPEKTYRIAFLGDDALLASDLPESATIPAMLEAALNARRGDGDPAVQSVNAAAPGFFLPPLHATLVERVLPLEPDMVVVMSVVEDVRAALASDWDETGARYALRGGPPSFMDWLSSVSDLAAAIRRQSRANAPDPSLHPTPVEQLAARDSRADPRRGLDAYRRELRLVGLACKDAKAELVLVTQPTLAKDSNTPEERAKLRDPDDALRKGVEAYNEELRAAAPRAGARLVDMASLMTRDLEHLEDDVHFTPVGSSRFVEIFVGEVWKDGAARRSR